MSTTEGLQVPLMPFSDVKGSAGTDAPAHAVSDVPNANDGVTLGDTVTLNVVLVAHCPAVGVNV